MATDIKFKNLHEGEIQELIGKTPSWPVSVGSAVILVVIGLLFIGSWFITLPIIVRGEAILMGKSPSVRLSARRDNRVELLVDEGADIKKGDTIAYYREAENYNDIVFLDNLLANDRDPKRTLAILAKRPPLYLGQLTEPYNKIKEALVDLSSDVKVNEKRYEAKLTQSSSDFHQLYKSWQTDHLILSPASGRLESNELWNTGKGKDNAIIFSIVPKVTSYTCYIKIPMAKSYLIRPGQLAMIAFDAYPYREFGHIIARVERISNIQQGNFCQGTVSIPGGLITSKGIRMIPNVEMFGTIEVIVKNENIAQRLLGKLL